MENLDVLNLILIIDNAVFYADNEMIYRFTEISNNNLFISYQTYP
jgi:hypothetical protein